MKTLFTTLLCFGVCLRVFAQDVTITVFDVGAGLCVVGEFPNDQEPSDSYYMIYDAGFSCLENVQSVIPIDDEIDLLVLSHNDIDHIATADDILEAYQINKIIWSGFERPETDGWVEVNQAIQDESTAEVINLRTDTLAIGSTDIFGQTYVTFVAGFHVPPEVWGISASQRSEYQNAGSIVFRVVYKGSSILLTGDMIGRHEDGDHPEQHVIAAEEYVIDNRHAVPIDSDVLVASHHGGDDGSSYPFIQAVSPEYVIFSAGSHDNYGHPRAAVAQRFMNSGVSPDHILRTDLGDDETKPEHWENETTIQGQSDSPGDDDILIRLTTSGNIIVEYCSSD